MTTKGPAAPPGPPPPRGSSERRACRHRSHSAAARTCPHRAWPLKYTKITKTPLNTPYSTKTPLNTLYSTKTPLNTLYSTKTPLNTLYSTKTAFNTLYRTPTFPRNSAHARRDPLPTSRQVHRAAKVRPAKSSHACSRRVRRCATSKSTESESIRHF